MRPLVRFTFLCVLLLLVAGTVFAQTTASLTGTVTSDDGSVLPGVTVTLSSPGLQGTRTAVTGDAGTYNFAGLPPGDYTISFELNGMDRQNKRTRVQLAQTSRVDATLRVAGVAEAITVTASAPSVLETPQVASNFQSAQIENLPVTRDVRNTVLLAPGVNGNGPGNNVMISGAPAYDSVYLVNGVVVNENLRGQPHSLFIEDSIQETTVITGSVSAEYGRFTGGVVNTITKSGGNEYRGSLRDSLSNPSWTEETPFAGQPDNPDTLQQIYEATLGGFFIRDRLWFFGAGRLAEKVPVGTAMSTRRFTAVTALPYDNFNDETRYEAKLTGRITSRHNLVASYLNIKLDETNNAFTPIADVDSIVASRSLPNTLSALSYNGVLTNSLLVEGTYAKKYYAFEQSGGRFTDPIRGTWIQDSARGFRFNAPVFCGVCTPEERNNESWVAKANYFLSTQSLGSHNFVGGYENFEEQRIVNNYQSASQYEIITGGTRVVNNVVYPIFDSGTRLRYRPIFDLSQGTDFATQSFFVNDRWDLNKNLSFNVGVRYDKNNGHDSSGNLVSDDSAFSPRLGLIYDVLGDGRFRVNASYSRYVSKIADGNVGGSAQSAGSPALFSYNYTGDSINGTGVPDGQLVPTHQALEQLFAWFNSRGGFDPANFRPNSSSVPGYSARFDDPISSPYVDEINVGFGTRIGAYGFARVDLMNREWGNFYAAQLDTTTGNVADPYGNRTDQSVTVNSDNIERTYQGLQLQANWQKSRLNFGGSYTLSKLEGNDEGEAQGTATSRNTPLDLWYPEYLDYEQRLPVGYLNGDQRHRARVWAGYELSTFVGNFNISVLESYGSGIAYSAIGTIDASGRAANFRFTGAPTNPNNVYLLNQLGNDHNYYFGKRGQYRTDSMLSTDLAINYSLPISRLTFFAQADVINVFNDDAVIDLASSRIDTTVYTARTPPPASLGLAALQPFNPKTDTPVEGVHYHLGPRFGQATSPDAYQQPRTYRVSLGLRF
ncbi:MAG TPA: carboxypeptidase regulatory-like domain-containing protein [Thermoanaerobaculia bacterium]